uniref:Putative secreted protein n=1 Tax=Anopheles darlingi TaxID=43151 RepID=A0A2M4D7I1_ANODA
MRELCLFLTLTYSSPGPPAGGERCDHKKSRRIQIFRSAQQGNGVECAMNQHKMALKMITLVLLLKNHAAGSCCSSTQEAPLRQRGKGENRVQ